jgi:hypothetical protein
MVRDTTIGIGKALKALKGKTRGMGAGPKAVAKRREFPQNSLLYQR